jgi:Flp pilus assembly protein, ATPase CpaE
MANAHDLAHEQTGERLIAPVPRVTIEAFCETPAVAAVLESVAADRRLARAQTKLSMGGAPAAVEAFRHAPTPNVIILETNSDREAILAHLDSLAEVCDVGTKVLVVGHVNDVQLYRELMRRGVSDYLIAPLSVVDTIAAISELFTSPGAEPLGRTIAVIGAKGGVGASTVAHNLGWSIARTAHLATVIADLDIAFGTTGLDFNQDPPQGIAEAVFSPDRVDSNLVDRLLSRCSDNLSLLAAPAVLDRTCDLDEGAFDQLLDVLRASTPAIVLDLPHVWTGWLRRVLTSADDVVIVAEPDLANLRNAKNLADLLRQTRPNDRKPRLILNRVGVPKRPEIATADFLKAFDVELAATIPFDAQLFGTAANGGQMLSEVQPSGKIPAIFDELAAAITGRAEQRRGRASAFLSPIIARFARRKS